VLNDTVVFLETAFVNVEFWKLMPRASKKGTKERVEFVCQLNFIV